MQRDMSSFPVRLITSAFKMKEAKIHMYREKGHELCSVENDNVKEVRSNNRMIKAKQARSIT